jgi:cobalt-zinc-cadmium efflux system outer membrane protein
MRVKAGFTLSIVSRTLLAAVVIALVATPLAAQASAESGREAPSAMLPAGIVRAPSVSDRVLNTLEPLTRVAAADAALAHGVRAALARADSLVARATLVGAREFANPTANLTYTKDTPNYHGIFNIPFDYPWVRDARVRAARLGLQSAAYRYAFERGAVEFEVDTTYTEALAAAARSRISHKNALDADSLRRLAIVRRDAGDASDMDVELTTVNAAQQANIAIADSLASIGAVLDLQALLGMPADEIGVTLVDTLTTPQARVPAQSSGGKSSTADTVLRSAATPAATGVATGAATVPLPVAAAEAELQSEESALSAAKRGALGPPALQAGVEGGDPGERGLLPTVGLSIPFPLFNQNGGEVALATANRDRAAAELALARRESAAQFAQATRALDVTLVRVRRDREMLSLADRVVARSLTAFADGASTVSAVLEAQRSARDALIQYVDDLAAANTAASAVKLFTLAVPIQ